MSSTPGRTEFRAAYQCTLLAALCCVALGCTSRESTPAAADVKVEHFAAIKWNPAFPGVEVAVLDGNPEAAGQAYSVLIKCADGAGTKPHTHPTDGSGA